MYEFKMQRRYLLDLPFTVFGTGLTIEAKVYLEVDGFAHSHDRDESEAVLDKNAIWDYDTAEFGLASPVDEDAINITLLTDHDEQTFLSWVRDIVNYKTGYTVEVIDMPRSMSRSEWEGD